MYVVVEFCEEAIPTIEVVPELWLIRATSESWWPPHKSQQQFRLLVQTKDVPSNNWSKYKIKILFSSGKMNCFLNNCKF